MPRPPATIDAYLAGVPPDRRAALQALRRIVRTVLPDAEECISYSMPAFRLHGAVVGGFQATSKGCSYYPFSGRTLATLTADLAGRSQTKSALHFTPEAPLPRALVRKLLQARLAEVRMTPGTAAKQRTARRPARPGLRRRGRAGGGGGAGSMGHD